MNQQLLFGVVIVPAVVGLTQVVKECGVPSRLAPAAAVFFGVLAGLAQIYGAHFQWIQAVVIGIALGLSAVGLYSGATSLFAATQAASPAASQAAPAIQTPVSPSPAGEPGAPHS